MSPRGVTAAGFDSAWILPYAHRPGVAESCNEWSAAEVTRYPQLVPGATFHPGDDDLPRLVRRALVELHLRVVKLHCSVGQFSPADPRLEPLWQVAAAQGVPIVVHAGQIHGGNTEAGEARELETGARTPPRAAAHRGAHRPSRGSRPCSSSWPATPTSTPTSRPSGSRRSRSRTRTWRASRGGSCSGATRPTTPAGGQAGGGIDLARVGGGGGGGGAGRGGRGAHC